MPYVLKTCPICGKEFKCYSYDDWAYKLHKNAGGKSFYEYYCSYHCMPATGLLNDKKYDDAKLRKQEKATYDKNREKYQERSKQQHAEHREERNAKAWLKYNAGTPESEAARLERNRKQCEWKKQRAIEKWKGEEDKC